MKTTLNFIIAAIIVYFMLIGISHVINAAIDRQVEKKMQIDNQAVKEAHDKIMQKFDRLLSLPNR